MTSCYYVKCQPTTTQVHLKMVHPWHFYSPLLFVQHPSPPMLILQSCSPPSQDLPSSGRHAASNIPPYLQPNFFIVGICNKRERNVTNTTDLTNWQGLLCCHDHMVHAHLHSFEIDICDPCLSMSSETLQGPPPP